ncbi:MAG TPA: hypothetical protein VHR15_15720 [Ktedonobacterales bacterium]|nr:hypothetical protein [Ktedonobacterales bacterium]
MARSWMVNAGQRITGWARFDRSSACGASFLDQFAGPPRQVFQPRHDTILPLS